MSDHLKHATNKVAIVAWAPAGNHAQFLLQLPRAKRNDTDAMQWGIARGTVSLKSGDDIRDASELENYTADAIEEHLDTFYREAKEELGLNRSDMAEAPVDHGLMEYVNADGIRYPLHVYSVKVIQQPTGKFLDQAVAEDTKALYWAGQKQAKELVANGEMKTGYLSILDAVETTLNLQAEKKNWRDDVSRDEHPYRSR
jgi:hypothetical protein